MSYRILFATAVAKCTLLMSSTTLIAMNGDNVFTGQLEQVGLEQVVGPLPGARAWQAPDEPAEFEAKLSFDLAPRGSLSFWVRIEEPFRTGPGAPDFNVELLSSPGLFDYRLIGERRTFGFIWRWRGIKGENAPGNFRVEVPGVPGPFWVHVAMEWDREKGIFDGYLNGTPSRIPGTLVSSWTTPPGNRLRLRVGELAVSDVRVSDQLLDKERLRQEVTTLYWRTLDGLLGAAASGPSIIGEHKGALLHEWKLAEPSEVEDWVMEGPGELRFQDGWMQVASERPKGPEGHLVFWPPPDLPGDFIAEWDFQLLEPDGLTIVFFCAKGRNGEDIFDPSLAKRKGAFPGYHSGDINCYHISYYANTPDEPGRTTSNLRKNHGFYLVTNGPAGILPGSEDIHRVSLMKRGARVMLAIDGNTIIDFVDDGKTCGPILDGGKFGLRQMQWTRAQYRNLRVHAVKE